VTGEGETEQPEEAEETVALPAEEAAEPVVPPPARRRLVVGAVALAVVLVLSALVGIGTWSLSRSHHGPGPAQSHAPDADGCRWWSANPAGKPYEHDVGVPPHSKAHRSGYRTMTLATNRGPIAIRLDAGKTPCTVASFTYLADRHFFNDTPCHRLVTEGIYLLQCGDPSGTGRGGPTYVFADELSRADPLPRASGADGLVTYPRGTVALANFGKDTNGSQFFVVYRDSPIPDTFTPFGTVESGMDIIDAEAKAGDDGAYAPDPGGGHPRLPLTIDSLTVG
jgi:peptidyl-prolyl cis-trans isomerase B (cyclophilin B)